MNTRNNNNIRKTKHIQDIVNFASEVDHFFFFEYLESYWKTNEV